MPPFRSRAARPDRMSWRPLSSIAAVAAALSVVLAATPAAEAAPPATPPLGGGQTVAEGAAPFTVALLRSDTEVPLGTPEASRQFCGGSLIEARTVLTAAHCVVEDGAVKQSHQVDVLVGRTNLTAINGRRHAVAKVTPHPAYDPATFQNDVALLTLAEPSNVLPVALVMPGQESLWLPNRSAVVLGWGHLVEGQQAQTILLQAGAVPVRSDTSCLGVPGWFYDPATQMCAGYPGGGVDSCQGDSGGPLIVADAGRFVQIGVVSNGRGCGRPQSLGIYGRVGAPALSAWIASGGAPAPAPAPAPAAAPARITPRLVLQSVKRRGGRRIHIRGRVEPALPGIRVNVQRRVRHRWVPNGHLVTSATGRFRGVVRLRRGLQRVRLALAEDPTRTRAQSVVRRVRVR